MDMASEFDRHRRLAALEQSDFTATVNSLFQTVTLTNFIGKGPTFPDEDIWITQVITQWKCTIVTLKEVFLFRSVMDAELDRILRESLLMLLNFSRDPSTAPRVGMTIQMYASRLHDHLQYHHAWHDPDIVACTCCRRQILQGIQQSVMHELNVLDRAVIPWQNLLHERFCV